MEYKLYVKNSSAHYLYIDLLISNIETDILTLQLPAWRPGRYELGNFAKNVKKVDVFDEKNNLLAYKKTNKDCWQINTNGNKQIKVTYSYYASELNAGSTYVDEHQLYVNPCNCLMYVPSKMQEKHTVVLEIPDTYTIASSLIKDGKMITAASFDELADSPFIAAQNIKSIVSPVNGIDFYLHFNGECNPQEERLKRDFSKFIAEQIAFFNGVHFTEYHFLIQMMPQKFHHGVEHTKNTVIAFGPSYHLMQSDAYNEFLGLCCHELFHTWNIKSIRPVEMYPYDFTKENYARTGFVYEGVTTYYGDKLLFSCDVFSEEVYFKTFEERLTKHLHSFGRYNLSVGDSSFDNWLDGYTPGAPYRKTNIYDEGCMVAFMLDVLIMKHSSNKNTLQTVMKNLYDNFYKKQKGYTEQDFTDACSDAAGVDLQDFFTKYVYGLEAYEPMLHESAGYVGLLLNKQHAITFYERYLGFKAIDSVHNNKKISMIAPYSPVWKAGLSIHDDIIAINNFAIKNDFNHWLNYFAEKDGKCSFTILSNNKLKEIHLDLKMDTDFFYTYKLVKQDNLSASQKDNYACWKQNFSM